MRSWVEATSTWLAAASRLVRQGTTRSARVNIEVKGTPDGNGAATSAR
jgi:hypothetical protein